MTEGAFVQPTAIYGLTAAALLVGAVLFVVASGKEKTDTRRLLLLATVPATAMGVAYVFMALEVATVDVTADGREQSVMRFVGYTAVLVALGFVFRWVVGLPRRVFAALIATFIFTPWAALASWLVGGTVESVVTVLVVVGYLTGTYLLFGPVGRETSGIDPSRQLLFAKLRNLFVICWAALIIQSAVSEQALGLMDTFVGQTTASYTDAVLVFGIFGLVYAANLPAETGDAATQNHGDTTRISSGASQDR